MATDERSWLLRHLVEQARYVATLTEWARDNASDADVLLRVRDEVFTLREALDTLGVPDATSSNDEWRHVPPAQHRDSWPRGDDPS
jgi:hypothetical protein